jgi:signal transduction histidine kinase
MIKTQIQQTSFRPKARLLLLLGDQLIREPGIAVFELVKNSYDADSQGVKILMEHIEFPDTGRIIVEDSGSGMDSKTITSVWLEPGTDYRKQQKTSGERTPIFNRLPLGEKGVGRFAAHKLGRKINLVSRKKGHPEVSVKIDWDDFNQDKYLSSIPIEVIEREPVVFTGDRTGTRIEITHLWQAWDRKMVRNLARSINSICSPFDKKGEFIVDFQLAENTRWLDGLLSVKDVLEYALFRAHCVITDQEISYSYEFIPYPAMRDVKGRKNSYEEKIPEKIHPDVIKDQIGSINVDLYIFDREPAILELGVSDRKGLKDFLDQNGGVRVYRDNVRVYDYGEPENDWLNLDARRVNIPAARISNNIVLGAVSLNLETSTGLIEKTNREGFVENKASQALNEAVIYVITQIEAERKKDKERIRNAYGRTQAQKTREPVIEELTILRQEIQKKGLEKEIGGLIDRIEADFILIRDRFISSASTGLSLSVVIHEVEKGIAELSKAVETEPVSDNIKNLAKHLADLVEGFAALIRRSGRSREKASDLIKNAIFNTKLRLKLHGITLEIDPGMEDFEAVCSRRLVISTLMNLIDNSIWWLDNKWGETPGKKGIYIGTSRLLGGDPAIIVADNGPGFMDLPEELVEPFFSRKPDGMGLGLHLADQVMKAQGGRLEFPVREVIALPESYVGAIVALIFKENAS